MRGKSSLMNWLFKYDGRIFAVGIEIKKADKKPIKADRKEQIAQYVKNNGFIIEGFFF